MNIARQLEESLDKVSRIIELCQALQEENDLLKLENHHLKAKSSTLEQENLELEEKLRVVALARSLEGAKSAEIEMSEKTLDIKQKIAEFVREIDKCIVLLKK